MSKYHNRKTIIDGVTFDSAAEARRYVELTTLTRAGMIRDLELQPRFEIIPAYYRWDGDTGKTVKVRATYYVADFMYFDIGENETVVEDTKGVKTAVYQIKRKLFEQRYPEYLFLEVAA